jgi:hypothetical protein
MASTDFDVIAKEQFNFLKSDFGFQLSKSEKKDWGYELIYLNKTTGVKITYAFREAYIFIMLYKLVDGNLIENPRSIQENTVLHGYGLDDIISLRNPHALIKPSYQYGEESEYYDKKKGLTLYVTAFSNNLKEYASDVLVGDFKIFSEAQRVVKERVKKYK